jgi:hypothetical protein
MWSSSAPGRPRLQLGCPSERGFGRETQFGRARSAVRAILKNPRYTGRQVCNQHRKEEVLLDVAEVALGYETKLGWHDPGCWVWSDIIAQEPW